MNEGTFALITFIVIQYLFYSAGCYHIDSKEEIVKKERVAQEDAISYCHHYCEKLNSNTFFYGPGTGCSCQFKIKGK